LRLSLQAQRDMRFNIWRDIDSYPEVHAETAELIKFLGLEGIEQIQGGELSYGGQRLVDLGIALGSKPQVCCSTNRWRALPPPSGERVFEPGQEHRRQYSGPDRRARYRPRARLLPRSHRE